MKKLIALLTVCSLLAACNTVRGIGQDIKKTGEVIEGAAKNNIYQDKADEIFDLMEKFAGYGFNKSHAAAYSLLAYHTAWLKVHFTAEFFCANMTVEMDNTDKLKVLLEDAQKMGLRLEAPA